MSDILYRVRTLYETDSAGAVSGMTALGSAASRLDGVLGVLKGAAGAVFTGAMVGGIAASIAGLALLAHGVHNVNGEIDSLSVGIAGMVNAAGVEGTEGVLGWANSMSFAEGAMEQIRRDAAALPGEAGDFIEVFRAGLPGALESGMRAADVAQFTNRFAAVGIAFRVDSEQIGRDLNLMLQGRAGAQVNMWNRLKSTIGKTAEEFNRLSAAQRQALIDRALRRYQPMIDAYANTWEAITSTTSSYGKDLLRLATNPFFTVAKKELRSMNDWWGAHETAIQEVANGIGGRVVDAYKRARREASSLFDRADAFVRGDTFQRLEAMAGGVAGRVRGFVDGAMARAEANPGEAATAAGAAAGVALGIPGLGIVAGALVQFATHTDAVSSVLGSLASMGDPVVSILSQLWAVFSGVEALLGNALAAILPGVVSGLASFLVGLDQAVAVWRPAIMELISALGPPVQFLGSVMGVVGNLFLTELGQKVKSFASTAASAISTLAHVIQWFTRQFGRLGLTMGDLGLERPAEGHLAAPPPQSGPGIMERLNATLQSLRVPLNAQQHAQLGAARNQRHVGHPGRTAINVHIHQTVNTNDDPDRILLLTRRGVYAGIHAPLQSPGVVVTH